MRNNSTRKNHFSIFLNLFSASGLSGVKIDNKQRKANTIPIIKNEGLAAV
jgi:hypothetical protein